MGGDSASAGERHGSKIKLKLSKPSFRLSAAVLVVASPAAWAPASAQQAPKLKSDQDVERLFATTCGWCHLDGGRKQGKGPQLMGTTRTDEQLVNRIATGKQGRMPGFGRSLDLEQLEAIVRYIRGLKPRSEGNS